MNTLINFLISLDPMAHWIVSVIIVIFVMAVILNLSIRRRYHRISAELEEARKGERSPFVSTVLQTIVQEYKKVCIANKSVVNTQAIVEEGFNSKMGGAMLGERFIKNSVSLMIVLGLFGTFLGLTMAVGELSNLLALSVGTDWLDILNSVGDGLMSSLQGMAVAFITSLFGIGCSILLTILNIIFNVRETRESVMVQIESYLDNYVAADVADEIETEYKVLAKVLYNSLQDFGAKIESSINAAMGQVIQHMSEAAAGMGDTAGSLSEAVGRFENSLNNFGENIRDLTEFNINLRNNIERMDVNFIKVTEAFKERRDREITLINMAEKLEKIEKILQKDVEG